MSRHGRRALPGVAASLVLVAVAVATAGCGGIPTSLACDVTIAAVPPGSTLAVDDPLPGDLVVLVTPAEIDRSATALSPDQSGGQELTIKATGDGVTRLANYTGTHVGDSIAIAINGTVVAVPIVNSSIPDGAIAITPGGPDQADFANRFAGCVH